MLLELSGGILHILPCIIITVPSISFVFLSKYLMHAVLL